MCMGPKEMLSTFQMEASGSPFSLLSYPCSLFSGLIFLKSQNYEVVSKYQIYSSGSKFNGKLHFEFQSKIFLKINKGQKKRQCKERGTWLVSMVVLGRWLDLVI